MESRHVVVGLVLAVTAMGAAACARDRSIPSAQDLSESLMTADDLDGSWNINSGPQGGDAAIDPSGILTEEQRELVPSFDFCDRASDDSRKVAATLRPLVFRQLDLVVEDGIDPPFDRAGHMVFLQEFLYVDPPYLMASSFASLREGMNQCLGEVPAGEEGPGYVETLPIPEVGEDRLGALITIEEAGGWAEWHVQEALVREGAVLMRLVLVDIRAGAAPYFTAEDFGEIVRTAASTL